MNTLIRTKLLGVEVKLYHESESPELQEAAVYWPANEVLCEVLKTQLNSDFRGVSILELGAGTCCLGIVIATLGANVTCTDHISVLPLMHKHLLLNNWTLISNEKYKKGNEESGSLMISSLDWTDYQLDRTREYRWVIGCELLYWGGWDLLQEDPMNGLIEIIEYFVRNQSSNVLLSFISRNVTREIQFFQEIKNRGLLSIQCFPILSSSLPSNRQTQFEYQSQINFGICFVIKICAFGM